MKAKILEKIETPEGVKCELVGKTLKCKKDSLELQRIISIPAAKVKVEGNNIVFDCDKGTKRELKLIKTHLAHVRNMFKGLTEGFTYKLQACNVHFPMTLKVEGSKLSINNFLGEKIPRYANIISGVEINVKGQEITITSHDIEAAGQTAANIEKATKVRNRDRRIFQDGIYIVEKPGREK
jgi:large subunit ribosomal protein L6